jgi:hypothetical protein
MERPDSTKILSGLKDFQRLTVDHVYDRLYGTNPVYRFLVADETGLGKTMVARGVIAKAVDHLWEDVKRIDIVYICANAAIARQNINKINITGQPNISVATRMTLLPLHLHNLQSNKLNFVSFTPDTSFNLGSRGGLAYERALMYHILRYGLDLGNRTGPRNLFQGGVTRRDNWFTQLDEFNVQDIDEQLADCFVERVKNTPGLLDDFYRLLDLFGYYRRYIPEADRRDQLKLFGRLRQALAASCVQALEPDIVILDEFQRFRDLLDGENEVSELARALFEFTDVRVLLLSATPYKMYTMHQESIENNHYQDFIRTVGFLYNSKEPVEQLKLELERYRREVIKFNGNSEGLRNAQQNIEALLRRVMVRTERLSVSSDPLAMIWEPPNDRGTLAEDDLRCYIMLDQIASELNSRENLMEYWKSIPYVLNIMDEHGYKFKREFSTAARKKTYTEPIYSALLTGQKYLLSWKDIADYKPLGIGHAKINTLLNNSLNNGAWQLLWIPPSLPYYQPEEGPYIQPELKDYTKSLVFSSWQVVPKGIAMLCSYEAERRMINAFSSYPDYKTEWSRRRGLLRFARAEERESGMSVFTLMYPSLTLAAKIDPLVIAAKLTSDTNIMAPLHQVKSIVRDKVSDLLQPIMQTRQQDSIQVDERWYWAAAVLMDSVYYASFISEWLESGKYGQSLSRAENKLDTESESALTDHIDRLYECFDGQLKLGRAPNDLLDVLVDMTLASPAVSALRALIRVLGVNADNHYALGALLNAAATTAGGYRTLFNLPETMSLIRSLFRNNDLYYWRSVLSYCVQGNLQAVMDEYIHILRESLGLVDSEVSNAAGQIAEEIRKALSLRTVTLNFDDIQVEDKQKVIYMNTHRIRCRFALKFGDGKDEELGEETRGDQVRSAFNSPFRPFVLASTSIGQEGLDFHHYCHEIYHWNLPSNPVDMEQREGRINRFKGHIIRHNLTQRYNLFILKSRIYPLCDPWRSLFEAAREAVSDTNELMPYWVYEVEDGYRISRHVPALPLSKEVRGLEQLRRSLAAYRMVFGQPRQEDVVKLLQSRFEDEVEAADLLQYRIDLSPR